MIATTTGSRGEGDGVDEIEKFPVRKRKPYNREEVRGRLKQLVELMKRQAGWTQADFARRVGLSESRLTHYLVGSYYPQMDAVAGVAQGIGVSLEWLAFGSGPIWYKDLQVGGVGTREASLALSAVLREMGDALEEAVFPSDGEVNPVARSAGKTLQNILEARLGESVEAGSVGVDTSEMTEAIVEDKGKTPSARKRKAR